MWPVVQLKSLQICIMISNLNNVNYVILTVHNVRFQVLIAKNVFKDIHYCIKISNVYNTVPNNIILTKTVFAKSVILIAKLV